MPGARQLENRQRVAVALAEELFTDRGVQRGRQVLQQERTGVGVSQAGDRQHRQSCQAVRTRACTSCAHQDDRFSQEPAGDEGEDLGRDVVEPLRVVDHA